MKQAKKVVAGYCRVSTDSRDQANSFENQHSLLKHRADKEGITLYETYSDKGMSGTSLDRPGLERMLHDAGIDVIKFDGNKDVRAKKRHIVYEASDRKPLFEEIWLKNSSRLARNSEINAVIDLLVKKGVHIFFIDQNLDTKSNTLLGLRVMQIFDEADSRDKSLKTKTGIEESARKGKVLTNSKIFGYHYDHGTNSLRAIESEAEVIRIIFTKYSEGLGVRRILNFLEEHGYRTRQGKPFRETTVSNILRNEKYAGYNNPLKYDKGQVFSKNAYAKIKPDYIERVKQSDRIEPIIDKGLFDACQEKRKLHTSHVRNVGIYRGGTRYSQQIFCGQCGAPYYADSYDSLKLYRCSKKKRYGVNVCDNRNISLASLDSRIQVYYEDQYEIFKGLELERISQRIFEINARLISYFNEQESNEAKGIKRQIESEIDKQKKRIDILMKMDNPEAYEETLKQADTEITRLKKQYELLNLKNDEIIYKMRQAQYYEKKAEELLKGDRPKTIDEMLKRIGRITIHKNGMNITLKVTDEVNAVLDEVEDIISK